MPKKTQQEVNEWERENQPNIISCIADWEKYPGYKVIEFKLNNGEKYVFEIDLSTTNK